jgi:glycosyltransferase involved in cell wall biosynthesis
MFRLAVVGADVSFPVQGDGVRDYSQRLARALHDAGAGEVDLFWLSREGVCSRTPADPTKFRSSAGCDLWQALRDYDAVILQYDMFRYDLRGFAPWLPWQLWRLRRARPNLKLAIMLHELHPPFRGWKWWLKYRWQVVQQAAMQFSADVTFAAVDAWVAELVQRRPQRPSRHLPVGSNLPDRRHAREWERLRLGAGRDTVVIASFGTDASVWRMLDYVVHAVNRVAACGHRVVYLNLGGNTPKVAGIDPDVRMVRPGFLPAEALAEMIAAADIFLAPFADGVSTRRTTLMAALQQGVAIVGTDGPLTDPLLRDATEALRLTPVHDPDAFARAAVALAASPAQRISLGQAARQLYCERFDWAVTARTVIAALSADLCMPTTLPNDPAEPAADGSAIVRTR